MTSKIMHGWTRSSMEKIKQRKFGNTCRNENVIHDSENRTMFDDAAFIFTFTCCVHGLKISIC